MNRMLLNIEELLAYCKWAKQENENLTTGSHHEAGEYATGISAGMAMAFDALADMIEGKIEVPKPDFAKRLFAEYLDLDEPMNAEDL